ncbi:MAG: hypothetical protein ACRDPR_17625, partial [Nocardioidaceae bacterium]
GDRDDGDRDDRDDGDRDDRDDGDRDDRDDGDRDDRDDGDRDDRDDADAKDGAGDGPDVYGDAAYGGGEFQDLLARNDIRSHCKTQPPTAPAGRFAKDEFDVDLDDDTVTCPSGETTTIRRGVDGDGTAYFGQACTDGP